MRPPQTKKAFEKNLCPPMSGQGKCDKYTYQLSSVQSFSGIQLFATPWNAAHQASLFITNSPRLLKLMSIESVMPSNHLFLCCPLLRSWIMFRRTLGQGLGRRSLARRGKLMSQRCGIKRINQNREWSWMREVMALESGRQHWYR